ncbi:hypothetical protein BV22DRAFT_606879 [Leucogyrophana mollusca]|uniref:Uncharacterized protein n=1 Tax=Leucogyrophana mollusca TaxID=85980 RepID=A0ACB8BEH0_9AGAM|nr:hypothetical protein BV22DRAFT_606879 [Leucogyrophana mollusca]
MCSAAHATTCTRRAWLTGSLPAVGSINDWLTMLEPHPSEYRIGHCYRRTTSVRLPGSDICQIFALSVSIRMGHQAIFRGVSVRIVDTTSKVIRRGPSAARRRPSTTIFRVLCRVALHQGWTVAFFSYALHTSPCFMYHRVVDVPHRRPVNMGDSAHKPHAVLAEENPVGPVLYNRTSTTEELSQTRLHTIKPAHTTSQEVRNNVIGSSTAFQVATEPDVEPPGQSGQDPLGQDSGTEETEGSGVIRVVTSYKLRPITELSGKVLLRVWWHIVSCK